MPTDDIFILSPSSTSSISIPSNADTSSPCSAPSISISANANPSSSCSALHNSITSNTTLSSPFPLNSTSYSSGRIRSLLKYETQQYSIIDNNASSAVAKWDSQI